MKKYGIFLGRMQPFHLGHQAVINEILLDGRIPIIVYGSSNVDRDINKNPLTFVQRRVLVTENIYPNQRIYSIKSFDYDDWGQWFKRVYEETQAITLIHDTLQDHCVLYYTNKEVDRGDFECFGKEYKNTWYTDIFKDQGFEMKEASFNMHPDLQINANARDIRANLEQNKHLLDARVYHKLKAWGWK